VLNVGLFFVLLFTAAERLPGGVAAAAGAVGPLVALVLGWPMLGIRPTWSGLATGALGVVGVAALVLGPAASLDAIGVAAAIGCAVSMATATVLARRWGKPPLSLVSLTAWQLTIGGLLVAPFMLVCEGVPPVPTARNFAGFALMGLFGTAVAYGLWIRGVTALPASAMQFLALLSPAVATAIGWATLGQSLSPVQLGGAVLVIVAVVAGQRVGAPTSDSTSSQFVTIASDHRERALGEHVKPLTKGRSREISR
jgi:probable blue pigment (indigoidine) exporter